MSLLTVERLSVQFKTPQGLLRAVESVGFTIARGESLGLVGESGSGKSALARAILRLGPAAQGRVDFDGHALLGLSERALRPLRHRFQPVFQDPTASLDPRLTVGATLDEALLAAGAGSGDLLRRAEALLDTLGLQKELLKRLPRELSSGQRQRVCIGRALAVNPEFLVLDEPLSALDVSVQAQVVELLVRLRNERGLTYLFISHDLGVVAHLCERVAVMHLGRIVEIGPMAEVLDAPRHPYTRALLASIPAVRPGARVDRPLPRGEPPSPLSPPQGCAFHPRCPLAVPRCWQELPVLAGAPHPVACHFPLAAPEKGA